MHHVLSFLAHCVTKCSFWPQLGYSCEAKKMAGAYFFGSQKWQKSTFFWIKLLSLFISYPCTYILKFSKRSIFLVLKLITLQPCYCALGLCASPLIPPNFDFPDWYIVKETWLIGHCPLNMPPYLAEFSSFLMNFLDGLMYYGVEITYDWSAIVSIIKSCSIPC